MENKRKEIAVIIGGGPAGLSAAYELLKQSDNIKPIILEKLDKVGGIARTEFHEGNGIDLGGHRLFTKNRQILDLWEHFLPIQGEAAIDYKLLKRKISTKAGGPDPDKTDKVMLVRNRISRIYYLRKFFDYPISMKPATFLNMGLKRTFIAGMSYLKSMVIKRPEVTLEDFMINRFGKVLYQMFFENYTYKVWGKHPSEISKEWGEQRIKGLSLAKALINAILSPLKLISGKNKETSLIEEYYYPKYGCGYLWQEIANEIRELGGEIRLNSNVVDFEYTDGKITGVKLQSGENISCDYVISSMPVRELVQCMKNVPEEIKYITDRLEYRDYILVNLCCSKVNLPNNTKIKTFNNLAPDSWIYLQENDITAGRLQIMNNWSPYVVEDFKNTVVLDLEYFCNEGDDMWNKPEEEMIEFGIKELEKLNMITDRRDILARKSIKVEKAYPAYWGTYEQFDRVITYLNTIENLFCIGRNGQHKYNNMDHSMLSGVEAVDTLINKKDKSALWEINTEKEYHEMKK